MTNLALAPRVATWRRDGDTWYVSSPLPLAEPPPTLSALLDRAAAETPAREFLIERGATGLSRVTYAEALEASDKIAAWLLRTGRAHRPVVALSGNSIDHALLMLGAMRVGAPFVPVSPAYSLASQDYAKLRRIAAKVRAGVFFAQATGPFARALEAIATPEAVVLDGEAISAIRDAPTTSGGSIVWPATGPEHVAKILFTSGSTGFPKGVPNTHRMLTSNQQMIAQLWPFLEEDPPVLVDWLPWSHTFGGNHNFNMVLFHGGTLFIDEGRPNDAGIGATLTNLRDHPPSLYFNVPAGFAALVPRLEADARVRDAFFSRLRLVFYAAAALPDDLWQRLSSLASSAGRDVFFTTAWGSTETSPLATSAHFPMDRAGNLGLPAPGTTLKLIPNGRKLEVRVKGPSVMSGYLDEPELTRAAFDEEGFYRIGDAVRLADPSDPSQGILFDGRVAEDFKLATGTWVNVGTLRTGVLAEAAPALMDLVVAGHDRPGIGILAWPSPSGCARLLGEASDGAACAASRRVRDHVSAAIVRWNAAHPESSTRIVRALLLTEPPSIDAGEITDKGYINQLAALDRRAALVARLFAVEPAPDVIQCSPA
jgi:feruloyl-CoA synthase